MKVRRRASVVCLSPQGLLTFHGRDPSSGVDYHFLPGGALEPGESPAQAALRETREETGYDVLLASRLSIIREYDFFWDGALVHCVSTFFGVRLANESQPLTPVIDAAYNLGTHWLPREHWEKAFGYHSAIEEAVLLLIGVLEKRAPSSSHLS